MKSSARFDVKSTSKLTMQTLSGQLLVGPEVGLSNAMYGAGIA